MARRSRVLSAAEAPPRYCPVCGPMERWAFGVVFHRHYVHVKIWNAPYWPYDRMLLATIVERTYPHGEKDACRKTTSTG